MIEDSDVKHHQEHYLAKNDRHHGYRSQDCVGIVSVTTGNPKVIDGGLDSRHVDLRRVLKANKGIISFVNS